jgi:CubicO group peptidase (beta-lactamase class C family)
MDVQRLHDSFVRLAHYYRVPGCQLVIVHDGHTIAFAEGEEVHGGGRKVTDASTFPIGSTTKPFTATLAMQLVADGDLDLDEPVTSLLTDLRGARDDHFAGVTLRHLLSHTAGLVSNHEPPNRESGSARHYLYGCRDVAPLHRPGEAFSYSNTGYVLAGCLIEAVTGRPWFTTVEAFLLDPLGIDAAFTTDPRPRPGRGPSVTGHTVRLAHDEVVAVDTFLPVSWAAAGALAVSAMDLVTLAETHWTESPLLDADALAEMREPVHRADPFGLADGWGLGLACFRAPSPGWFGHDGTTEGTTCNLRFDPRARTAVALTTNATSGLMLWDALIPCLAATGIQVGHYDLPWVAPSATAALADCTGDYHNGETRWTVSVDGDGLLLADNSGVHERAEVSENLMFLSYRLDIDDAPGAGRFIRDPGTGRVTHLQISGRTCRREQGPDVDFRGTV